MNTIYIITGIMFTLLLILVFKIKKQNNLLSNSTYFILTLSLLVGYILELVMYFLSTTAINNIILEIYTKLYLIFIICWSSIFSVYIFLLSKKDDEYNKNDIPKDRYIILQMSSDFNVGDYVIVNENDSYKLKKVTKVDNFEYTLNYSNLDEETTATNKDIISKVVYNNATFSNLFGFFTNIITVIILFVIVVMIPNFTYKRYS